MEDGVAEEFNATDEVIVQCLLNKVLTGKTPLMREATECDLYGDEEAWRKVFEETGHNCVYFLTRLKKTSENSCRFSRSTAGCNTWKVQSDKKICIGETHIGSKRCLTFKEKEKNPTATTRWTMHEFRLDGVNHRHNQDHDYVMCRVRRIISKKAAVHQQQEAGEEAGEDDPKEDIQIQTKDNKTVDDDPSVTLPKDQESMEQSEEGGDQITEWGSAFAQKLLAHRQDCLDEEKEELLLLPNPFYENDWVRGWQLITPKT